MYQFFPDIIQLFPPKVKYRQWFIIIYKITKIVRAF